MATTNPYQRDPNRVRKPRGSAKLVLVRIRAENARRILRDQGFRPDQFSLNTVRTILDSILAITEEEKDDLT